LTERSFTFDNRHRKTSLENDKQSLAKDPLSIAIIIMLNVAPIYSEEDKVFYDKMYFDFTADEISIYALTIEIMNTSVATEFIKNINPYSLARNR
jgi:hypothetical protein